MLVTEFSLGGTDYFEIENVSASTVNTDSMPPAPYAYRQLEDPAQEAEAAALMATLRCLTCQSQSIADSNASMAGDMRHQVRTRIAAGEDPEAIRQWLVARYGDYVSYQPRVTATTWPLFAIPLLLVRNLPTTKIQPWTRPKRMLPRK